MVALVLETMREPPGCGRRWPGAADRDVPVVVLTVGGSAARPAMVAAHSGALAGGDGGVGGAGPAPTGCTGSATWPS